MRWRTGRRSANVEDRRGMGSGLPRPAMIGGGGGCVLLVLLLVGMWLGVDPMQLLQGLQTTEVQAPPDSGSPGLPAPGGPAGPADERAEFVAVVLAETEDVWNALFAQGGQRYEEPILVLFSDAAQSACGFAQAAVGPFYCPADRKLYVDLTFFDELGTRFGAPGDFAQAYVVAHEVGHHVQNLLGVAREVQALQQRAGEREANAISVRMELQADCFAGVWAHHAERTRGVLEPGDIDEALGAAAAIGDDRIQRETRGYVVPDSFTHGSSAERAHWFREGFSSGDLQRCDTFSHER